MAVVKMKIKLMKLASLNAADYNPRVIDDKAAAGLSKSIERFGCVEPIVVNVRGGANRIVGGHQRCRAMIDMGMKEALCALVDLSDAEEKALNLALNNPNTMGKFIEDFNPHLETVKDELGDDELFDDLRLGELFKELEAIKAEEKTAAEGPVEGTADVLILVGEYRMLIQRADFDPWIEQVRIENDYNTEVIQNAILAKLGIVLSDE